MSKQVSTNILVQRRVNLISELCGCDHLVSARIMDEIMLPMADRVCLHTLIFRPSLQPCSVIATRSSYPFQEPIYRMTAEYFCSHGFAYVVQYCRGCGKSEGVWEPNVNERADGLEMMDWLSRQSWVRNIGYFGCSYLALTGWAMADALPKKVKTMFLSHYGVFRHTSAFQDGMFRHDVLTNWTMRSAGFPIEADFIESCLYHPHICVDTDLWGRKLPWYRDWVSNADPNSSYWKNGFWGMLAQVPGKVKIPICMLEGWYDHHLGSALKTFEGLPSDVKSHSRMIIGGWGHNFGMYLEDRECHNADNVELTHALEWFEMVLKKETLPEGQVRAYTIQKDSWRIRKSSQPPHILSFYLSGQEADKHCTLQTDKPSEAGAVSYVFNPEHPVPTHGAESLLFMTDEIGSLRQPEPSYRPDVLSFISAPLQAPITISGSITVPLTVSTDAEDTAFSVKIMEVTKDGIAYNIRSGITSIAYRNHGSPESYAPGQRVNLEVVLWDIEWQLQPGSRIRLDISSSDFPQYAIHSNFSGSWAEQAITRPAQQHIYWGGNAISCVRIPVTNTES